MDTVRSFTLSLFSHNDNTSSSSSNNNHQIPLSEDPLAVAFEVLIAICFLLGFVLNLILLLVFIKRRGFRSQLGNRFVLSLVLANLFSCLMVMPIVLADNMLVNPIPSELCKAFNVFFATATAASLLSQTLIGTDQYLAIVHPLHYHRKSNSAKYNLVCLGTLLTSMLFGGGRLFDLELGENSNKNNNSLLMPMSPAFGNLFFLLVYLLPLICLAFVYARIFWVARHNSLKNRRNSSCSSVLDGLQQQQQRQQHQSGNSSNNSNNHLTLSRSLSTSNRSTISNITVTMRHKLSNASGIIFAYREETRAAKLAIFVLLNLLACWTPYFGLVLAISNDLLKSAAVAKWVNICVLTMACLSPVLTPFLYAYRSSRVRREVRRVLGCYDPNIGGGSEFSRIRRHFFRYSEDWWSNTNRRNMSPSAGKLQRAKSFSCPQLHLAGVAAAEEKGRRIWKPKRKLGVVLACPPELPPPNRSDLLQQFVPMMLPAVAADVEDNRRCRSFSAVDDAAKAVVVMDNTDMS